MKKNIMNIITIIVLLSLTGCNKDSSEYNPIENDSIELYCTDDYFLVGSTCYKTDIIMAEIEYDCDIGYLQGNQCVSETSTLAVKEYNCPIGYGYFGLKCQKNGTSTNYIKCGSFNMTYDYFTDMCYSELDPIETWSCYFGELVGNSCVSRRYMPAYSRYKCPYGYTLNNLSCERKLETPAYIK